MYKPTTIFPNIKTPAYFLQSIKAYSTSISRYGMSLLVILLLCIPQPSFGFNFGTLLDDVGNAVKSGINTIEESVKEVLPVDKNAPKKDTQDKSSPTAAKEKDITKSKGMVSTPESAGGSIFSKGPINPAEPPVSTQTFTTGEKIYGMLKAAKPWKLLNKNNNYLIVYFYIDGEQKIYKSVGLNRPELLDRDYFIIDIAPDPSEMSNYTDRDIVFPEKDGYKFGPEIFTKYLSELTPGTHSIRLEVKAYNKIYASGEFSISGDDYSVYSSLLADIKNSSGKQQKMPQPGMTNMALQNEMIGLLKNGGWPDIRRLVIVDKDWWLDRVEGGDSALKSRHIEAAAATKDVNGSFYFHHVTFHQPMLITGDWGKLELTHTGKKITILENNIDK